MLRRFLRHAADVRLATGVVVGLLLAGVAVPWLQDAQTNSPLAVTGSPLDAASDVADDTALEVNDTVGGAVAADASTTSDVGPSGTTPAGQAATDDVVR